MKIDHNNLDKMIADGYINVQKHPTEELYIYNYSNATQFDQVWNPETLMCRGLIMDADRNIIARPFSKFFNLSEVIPKGEQLPNEDFIVTEKMDGSLGILYQIKDQPFIATRGSFASDQAIAAGELLHKKYSHVYFDPQYTYLFEIILPWNRIVVDYGHREALVLLAITQTRFDQELPYDKVREFALENGFTVAKRYDALEDHSKILSLDAEEIDNSEGYVIHYPKSGKRYKIKFAEYKRLHKLLTGINAKTIWELLRNSQGTHELIERVPDEFYQWVQNTIRDLNSKYYTIEGQAIRDFEKLMSDGSILSRKDFALKAKQTKYPHIMFAMHDKKPYKDAIWKMIRPVAEKAFRCEN